MKQLLAVLGVFLLLTSCQGVKNEIKQRLISQDFTFVHGGDTIYKDPDHTFLLIRTKNDPNSWQKYDSIYIVSRTWSQAWTKGGEDGSRIIFFIGLIGTIVGLILAISKFQKGAKDSNDKSILGWVIIPFIFFGIMGGALGWDKWNSDREITKKEYISSTNLDNLWQQPAKTY